MRYIIDSFIKKCVERPFNKSYIYYLYSLFLIFSLPVLHALLQIPHISHHRHLSVYAFLTFGCWLSCTLQALSSCGQNNFRLTRRGAIRKGASIGNRTMCFRVKNVRLMLWNANIGFVCNVQCKYVNMLIFSDWLMRCVW